MPEGEQIDKLEMAGRSYKEVLAATVHQDDKVGRIITAAAFLTTGALTIITRTAAPSVRLDLLGVAVPVVAIAVGVYFACTMFAVVALVLTLSTPHVHLSSLRKDDDSLLFFNEIGKQSRKSWLEFWEKPPEELREKLETNYQVESLNLARRVLSKYDRTFIAVRVFELGIFYLAVGGLAYLFGFVDTVSSTGEPQLIQPDYLVRSIFLAALVAYLCLILLAVREQATYDKKDWQEMEERMPEHRYRRGATMRLAGRTLLCLVLFVTVVLMVPTSLTHWIPVFLLPGCFVMLPRFKRSMPVGIDGKRIDGKRGGTWIETASFGLTYSWLYASLSILVMTVTLGIGVVIALIPAVPSVLARLAATAAVPVFLLAMALTRQTFSARDLAVRLFGKPRNDETGGSGDRVEGTTPPPPPPDQAGSELATSPGPQPAAQ